MAAAVVGLVAGGVLLEHGLAQLEAPTPRHAKVAGRVACALGGRLPFFAARHADSRWLLPGLLVWACGLGAAATCDALTQRVPTPLVRQSSVVTAVLVGGAAAPERRRWAG